MAVGKVSDANFENEVLKASGPVVVDFWAEWCGPCRQIAPALEEIAGALGDKVKIVKLNVDENPATAAKYGIMSIPTLMMFKNGELASRQVGAAPKRSWSSGSPPRSDRALLNKDDLTTAGEMPAVCVRAVMLPLRQPFAPMEALSVDEIPAGDEWQYEPKWDGFRCLVFRDGDKVELQSKSGQPLTRYFPEIVEAVAQAQSRSALCSTARSWCRGQGGFSFDDLLQRIHPAASRIAKLAKETPALLIVFDLLADADGKSLDQSAACASAASGSSYSPGNISRARTASAFRLPRPSWPTPRNGSSSVGATLDGIIAKRRDCRLPVRRPRGMQKIKNYRSADCVVGGFRYNEAKPVVGSLLLGLYDDERPAPSRRLHLDDQERRKSGADQEAGEADRAAGLHRQHAGRAEPLVDQALGRMAAAQAEAGGRGLLRPFHRRPLPPRHAADALAAGQVAEAMHARSGEAEEGESDEAAEVMFSYPPFRGGIIIRRRAVLPSAPRPRDKASR